MLRASPATAPLPARDVAFAPAEAAAEPVAADAHTILIVDDEPPTLLVLRFIFRREGYHVLTAETAAEAMALLNRQPVSLVIVDQNMPDMTGIELLKQIRQKWPDTFRVLFTAYADAATIANAINEGHVFHYVTKPWDNDHLRAVVREGVRRHELTHNRRQLGARVLRQTAQLQARNVSLEQIVAERTAEVEAKNAALEETLLGVVRTLSGILEMRGIGPKGHALRVSQGCEWIGNRLNLPPERRLELSMAATLHDIGKVSLPDDLVRKDPFAFTRVEAAMYREHPLLGQAMLSGIRQLEGVGRIIRCQGEWYNGAGYPDGLVGEQIPIGSRIIAVVDAYEERRDESLLQQGIGRRFDPQVTTLLVEYLAEHPALPQGEGVCALAPHELREGMKLLNDVYTGRGLLLVGGGKAIDKPTLEKIQNFNRIDPITGKIYVQV